MIKRILIIDDDKEMCEELREILKDEGYNVSAALDGLEVKSLIEKFNYDILLLDLKLPGISGFDILKNIKEKDMKLKVIIITGNPLKTLLKEEVETLKLADEIISKPFDIEVVLGKIKELLNVG